jgi:hypothetical protein
LFYQYLLGKWHARLAAVLGTYLALGVLALAASLFFLHQDLSLGGCLMALVKVAALLAAVITCGVTVSALTNSTVVGIAVLWVVLYGGFALDLLPPFPSPGRALHRLPHILHGEYNLRELGERIAWSAGVSFVTSSGGPVLVRAPRCVRPGPGATGQTCGGKFATDRTTTSYKLAATVGTTLLGQARAASASKTSVCPVISCASQQLVRLLPPVAAEVDWVGDAAPLERGSPPVRPGRGGIWMEPGHRLRLRVRAGPGRRQVVPELGGQRTRQDLLPGQACRKFKE